MTEKPGQLRDVTCVAIREAETVEQLKEAVVLLAIEVAELKRDVHG